MEAAPSGSSGSLGSLGSLGSPPPASEAAALTTRHLVHPSDTDGTDAAVTLADVHIDVNTTRPKEQDKQHADPSSRTDPVRVQVFSPARRHVSLNAAMRAKSPQQRRAAAIRHRLKLAQSSSMEAAVTVDEEPIVLTNLINVFLKWGTLHKQRQKLHEKASLFFAVQYRQRMLPFHIISVVLGCSAVADGSNNLLNTGREELNAMALRLGAVLALTLFLLSLMYNAIFLIMEQYWRSDTLSKQHEQRSRLFGQFSLQCERAVGTLRLKRDCFLETPSQVYTQLMATRTSMLENTVLLTLPPHLQKEQDQLLASGTPMLVPMNTPAMWATPCDEDDSHGDGARVSTATPPGIRSKSPRVTSNHRNDARIPPRMNFQVLVRHVQAMAQRSPKRDLVQSCPPPVHIAHPFHRAGSDSDAAPTPMAAQTAFKTALESWQQQAIQQADELDHLARRMQRYGRRWDAVRVIPSIVLQVTTSINLMQQMQRLSDEGGAGASSVWTSVWNIMVVVLLVLHKVFEHMHGAFNFETRAVDADAHMRQLRNFAEQIATVAINQEAVAPQSKEMNEFMKVNLEKLRQARKDIREQFSLQL